MPASPRTTVSAPRMRQGLASAAPTSVLTPVAQIFDPAVGEYFSADKRIRIVVEDLTNRSAMEGPVTRKKHMHRAGALGNEGVRR